MYWTIAALGGITGEMERERGRERGVERAARRRDPTSAVKTGMIG